MQTQTVSLGQEDGARCRSEPLDCQGEARMNLAQLNAAAIDALTPPNNQEEADALVGLAEIRGMIDKARRVAQKAAQAGLYNDPDVVWLLNNTDRG